jgi:hypothetical protein
MLDFNPRVVQHIRCDDADDIRNFSAEFSNIAYRGGINPVFHMTPQEETKRGYVRRTGWPPGWSIASYPSLWEGSVQKIAHVQPPVLWCAILLENHVGLLRKKLRYGKLFKHVQVNVPGYSWLNEEEGSDNSVFHHPTPKTDLFAVSDVFPNTVWVL